MLFTSRIDILIDNYLLKILEKYSKGRIITIYRVKISSFIKLNKFRF